MMARSSAIPRILDPEFTLELVDEESAEPWSVWWAQYGFLAGRGGNPYHDKSGRFTHGPGGPKTKGGGAGEPVPEERAQEMQNGSAAEHLVQGEDGEWRFTEERQALHDRIIEEKLRGKVASSDPTYNMLGGGPASGKSAILESAVGEHMGDSRDTVVLNPDDMKAALPEYGPMVRAGDKSAASFTHAESSYLTARLQQEAIQRRVNVTLDSTGDSSPSKLIRKGDAARAAGYSVRGTYVTVPTEMAVTRAIERAERTGRWIPEGYLRATHAAVSNTAMETYQSFDSWDLYDTRAGSAEHVFSWDGETATVLNEGLWAEFQAKAGEAG